MTKTLYRAPWIVAYQDGSHTLLENGCLVVEDDRIAFVGRHYEGEVDQEVKTRSIITPGLISTHAHMNESPIDKTIVEDANKRQFWSSSLIEILPPRASAMTDEDKEHCVDLSLATHLLTGTTTVMQMGEVSEYVVEAADRTGIRAYIAESYRSGRWLTRDGRRVEYEWFDDDGKKAMDAAAGLVRNIHERGNERLRGWLNPSQVDTCSEALLRESMELSQELDVPISIHAAQSLTEFVEMTRRNGRTPIEWLDDVGFLNDRVILGHALFLSGTPWVNFAGDDLGLIARSGASVSYNAWTFGRNGINMFSYDKYLKAGVNVCLGTDSDMQSMLESLRWTAVLGKIAERRSDGARADQAFNSATIDAANYLGRPDLGRISEGAKADLLFWNNDSPSMTPSRDPIKSIVYYAQPEDLRDVMVSGEYVVRDREVRGVDIERSVAAVKDAGRRVWSTWPEYDWGSRTIDEHIPLSYPRFA
ncbi:amidohydrolase family protein [Gulosibacter sp. ACHW.36C]|uniref:Amidohydrolase family protein n=1 Tax=Gulosibacter sediminis TaxID=1729695 RepID=A0ABY4MW53_9MICO|nr:amidohydrolase family protein [Gulosibacter sediminis]UQN14655.1 amidohydrolase family protein [Gulosibacter sediminis]